MAVRPVARGQHTEYPSAATMPNFDKESLWTLATRARELFAREIEVGDRALERLKEIHSKVQPEIGALNRDLTPSESRFKIVSRLDEVERQLSVYFMPYSVDRWIVDPAHLVFGVTSSGEISAVILPSRVTHVDRERTFDLRETPAVPITPEADVAEIARTSLETWLQHLARTTTSVRRKIGFLPSRYEEDDSSKE